MVRIGNDLVVIGGDYGRNKFSDALFRFSCRNNSFKWEELKQKLKTPRAGFIAMAVPDSFLKK